MKDEDLAAHLLLSLRGGDPAGVGRPARRSQPVLRKPRTPRGGGGRPAVGSVDQASQAFPQDSATQTPPEWEKEDRLREAAQDADRVVSRLAALGAFSPEPSPPDRAPSPPPPPGRSKRGRAALPPSSRSPKRARAAAAEGPGAASLPPQGQPGLLPQGVPAAAPTGPWAQGGRGQRAQRSPRHLEGPHQAQRASSEPPRLGLSLSLSLDVGSVKEALQRGSDSAKSSLTGDNTPGSRSPSVEAAGAGAPALAHLRTRSLPSGPATGAVQLPLNAPLGPDSASQQAGSPQGLSAASAGKLHRDLRRRSDAHHGSSRSREAELGPWGALCRQGRRTLRTPVTTPPNVQRFEPQPGRAMPAWPAAPTRHIKLLKAEPPGDLREVPLGAGALQPWGLKQPPALGGSPPPLQQQPQQPQLQQQTPSPPVAPQPAPPSQAVSQAPPSLAGALASHLTLRPPVTTPAIHPPEAPRQAPRGQAAPPTGGMLLHKLLPVVRGGPGAQAVVVAERGTGQLQTKAGAGPTPPWGQPPRGPAIGHPLHIAYFPKEAGLPPGTGILRGTPV